MFVSYDYPIIIETSAKSLLIADYDLSCEYHSNTNLSIHNWSCNLYCNSRF